ASRPPRRRSDTRSASAAGSERRARQGGPDQATRLRCRLAYPTDRRLMLRAPDVTRRDLLKGGAALGLTGLIGELSLAGQLAPAGARTLGCRGRLNDIAPTALPLPFPLDERKPIGQCLGNISQPNHDWAPQHLSWNHGRNDRFYEVHSRPQYDGALAVNVMGYYEQQDI